MYNHNSFSTPYSIYSQKYAMVSINIFQLLKNNKVPANCQILYTATNAVMIFAYLGV